MKKLTKFKNLFSNYFPLIFVCSYIFYQSSKRAVVLSYNGDTNFFLHKLAHVIVYSLVFLTATRAFKNMKIAVFFGILFGISDEIHQNFVPTRTASVVDVLIDSISVLTTFFLVKRFKKYLPKFMILFLKLR
jgi:VanZ family protein